MAGLDTYANVNATTNWLERWYSKPLLLGYFLLGLIVAVGYFSPNSAEALARLFFFLASILKGISPQFLSVRYGMFSSGFYENVLALMFFSAIGSAMPATCLYVLRYYNNPAGFAEFVLRRMGRSYFLLAVLNITSLFLAWMSWFCAKMFYGLTIHQQYDLSKSILDFAGYSFLASAFITTMFMGLPLPVSSLFYLVQKKYPLVLKRHVDVFKNELQ